jgi:hypothetical protein
VHEWELCEQIGELCDELGLLWHWCKDPRSSCKGKRGLPDLIIAGEHGLLVREIKSPGYDTSAAQDLWIWTLHQSGADVAVWWPADWESGRIRRELEAVSASSASPPAPR